VNRGAVIDATVATDRLRDTDATGTIGNSERQAALPLPSIRPRVTDTTVRDPRLLIRRTTARRLIRQR